MGISIVGGSVCEADEEEVECIETSGEIVVVANIGVDGAETDEVSETAELELKGGITGSV